MRLVAFVVLASIALAASAESWVVGSLASYHFDRAGQNERNWGLGVEHGLTESLYLVAGRYRNSEPDDSDYLGGVLKHTRIGSARLGTLVAAVWGYERNPCLLIAPVLAFEGKQVGLNVGLIPGAGGVLFVQAKWRFR